MYVSPPNPTRPADAVNDMDRMAGENHYRATITNAEARQLRRDYAAGDSTASLSRRYGLTPNTTLQIAVGRRYRSAGGPFTRRKPRICNDWVALWIRVLSSDFSNEILGAEFGLSPDMVKRIRYGLSYAWLNDVLPKGNQLSGSPASSPYS